MSTAARPYPYYPFLLAAYSVVTLLASNINEAVTWREVAALTMVAMGFAALCIVIARAMMRDRHKGALVASSLLVGMLWYGYAWRLIPSSLNPVIRDSITLGAFGALTVLVSLATRNRSLIGATKYLNLVGLFLLLMPISMLLFARTDSRQPLVLDIPKVHAPRAPVRDIYLIVLDAYTSSKILTTEYKYDNSSFTEALRRRGFVVPSDSRANYASTLLALASMLNWEYLDTIPKLIGTKSASYAHPYSLIENNRIARYLKAAGYRYAFFPTTWPGTNQSRLADEVVSGTNVRVMQSSAISDVWLSNTILPVISLAWCASADCKGVPFPAEGAVGIESKFRQLANIGSSGVEPKFVFAHLLVPHEPFEFNGDCTHRESFWPFGSDDPAEERKWRSAYIAQVECLNRKLLELIDSILVDARVTPIILLQADHGLGRFARGGPPELNTITAAQLRDRAAVFSAYLLPEFKGTVPQSTSPVNLFRIVLREYFGAQLQPLADRTFYSSSRRPFDFTEIDHRTDISFHD